MQSYLKEILKRKDLLIYLVKSGLKSEHRNSYLGYFWWLLDPLLGVLIYYFLVAVLLDRGGENYGVFLVIGLVAWRWSSTTISKSARAITSRSSIINQVYLPKAIFPMTKSLTELINFSFGLVVIAIFLVAFGVMPGWQVIYLPLIMLVQLLFLQAISLFVAYVCVFIRDIDNILTHVIRILFYASPVIWEGGRLPEQYQWIVDINPFAHLLNAYRDILMYQTSPQLSGLLILGFISLLAILGLLIFYNRNEHKIIKAL
ncbi:teichoic acid translocation permease protein TagG [Halalkalibacter wakoensis JCM 9140]|uniref:Transport permease protein n=1 Tax=Halalkalibacter wakoensis JCM 9140 TaxID=1236970 RepID=W4Q2P1_9BACI|nr:ABC transporter permease [Halalkalibacter wakoensis]GAE26257.1 teichoic acid translocation permease protein TagG [Halalkalibacter wakoensis JCM 9140]